MKDSQFFLVNCTIEFEMTKQVYKYFRKAILIDMKNTIVLNSKFRLLSNDNFKPNFVKKIQNLKILFFD